ncbi:hypothetical protein [Parendozoicomonas sp. Alg238-R29]|uniref:hypothetical protein n=1 Tax=Parendozoicomonas sp. Alg238-R29 TaxID=2993446 RepID=UPI00248DAA30|nr:hypothetical protein [Parendozoicomonas sp. Alg238-R29]
MDIQVTDLDQYREEKKADSAFLNVLDQKMRQEDAIKPIPKSLFSRIARLQKLAEDQGVSATSPHEELLEG